MQAELIGIVEILQHLGGEFVLFVKLAQELGLQLALSIFLQRRNDHVARFSV